MKIFSVLLFSGVVAFETVNYNLVYDKEFDNYQINFINDVAGIFQYGQEKIEFVTEQLSNAFIMISKEINYDIVGNGWHGWKFPLVDNLVFNGYNVSFLKQLLNNTIQSWNWNTINQCEQQNNFILDNKLLNAIFQGRLAIRYTLVAFAILDLILIIKKYDEYSGKILKIFNKLQTKKIIEVKDFSDNVLDTFNITNKSLKDFLKMPRFISLFFSDAFFLFFKTNNQVQELIDLDKDYNIWKKIFVSKSSNFFYTYCYDLFKIVVTLPVILSSILVNVNLLEEKYDNDLLVLLFFSVLSLFLSLSTPCIIKSFEGEPKVYLIQFWLSIFRLVLIGLIMGWFLD
jgi:hypothetical protein